MANSFRVNEFFKSTSRNAVTSALNATLNTFQESHWLSDTGIGPLRDLA